MKEHKMPVVEANPILAAIIDGPVSALDRTYAFEELRKLSHRATIPVDSANVRLFSEPTTQPRPVAVAECALVIEGGKIIVAGAVGSTVREAVDEMMVRLRRRVEERATRGHERSGHGSMSARRTA
jgi:ribosome-associated translation inhibitor RaiA